ncbi:MAG: peptide chain release factor 1 [Mailhella sp.]|nr:peptide chain release factor 1 [Mailhella sp.]
MFAKLEKLEQRYNELELELVKPEVLADMDLYRKTAKARADLEPIVLAFREYRSLQSQLEENRELLSDEDHDIREMAQEEIRRIEKELPEREQKLRIMLLPPDPLDEKNTVLEVRAGTGGDEAALFAADLFHMYCRYAELMHWKVEIISEMPTDGGGYKEVIALVSGKRVYSHLRYESGTHRVQRVPVTESQGRIHTSAATVAVLPEAEEVDVDIKPEDLRIDVYRASGAGGQHVNKTESAVRITHIPTGIVVTCEDERSQHKNKARAMKVLASRILQAEQEKQHSSEAAERRSQVGSGDRSERIRTYNFPQGRVTDHRINLTMYSLDRFMEGEIEDMVEALATAAQADALRAEVE